MKDNIQQLAAILAFALLFLTVPPSADGEILRWEGEHSRVVPTFSNAVKTLGRNAAVSTDYEFGSRGPAIMTGLDFTFNNVAVSPTVMNVMHFVRRAGAGGTNQLDSYKRYPHLLCTTLGRFGEEWIELSFDRAVDLCLYADADLRNHGTFWEIKSDGVVLDGVNGIQTLSVKGDVSKVAVIDPQANTLRIHNAGDGNSMFDFRVALHNLTRLRITINSFHGTDGNGGRGNDGPYQARFALSDVRLAGTSAGFLAGLETRNMTRNCSMLVAKASAVGYPLNSTKVC